jgi:excinuclease ABC subunit C
LHWNSQAHRLVRVIRDEVHRFGIQFHRSQRSKGALENSLDQIAGIGPKTKELLLVYFKSVQKIKEAKLELLTEIIGAKKAQILKDAFLKDPS